MMAGKLNGSGRSHDDDGKVASLADARKRAADRARQEKRARRNAARGGAMSVRDWIIGGVLILMALGMLWHWLAPLAQWTGATR